MRLLDTKTGQFVDHNPHTDIYAILSHTWVPEGEQSYQDLQAIQRDYGPDGLCPLTVPSVSSSVAPRTWLLPNYDAPQMSSIWNDPRLSRKIRFACDMAAKYGFRYIWIDSCCINKENSAEWSEAINSMFAWYRDARICFAFLADVPSDDPQHNTRFKASRWFTRGWTLQELITPREVVFISQDWKYLGSKHALAPLLQEITGISQDVLRRQVSLDQVSVAKRMSWASNRETTKLEDEAYSLLGIFNIYMPALYGEGRHAFSRLQQEILRRIPDQSLFAWGNAPVRGTLTRIVDPRSANGTPSYSRGAASHRERQERPPLLSHVVESYNMDTSSLFATSPRDFSGSNGVIPIVKYNLFTALLGGINVPTHDYGISPYGTRTQFPLLSLSNKAFFSSEDHDFYIAILACTDEHHSGLRLLGRLCVVRHFESPSHKIDLLHAAVFSMEEYGACSLFVLPTPGDLRAHNLLRHIRVRTVYLPPHPDREPPRHEDASFRFKPPRDLGDGGRIITVRFPEWAADRLRLIQGYNVKAVVRNTTDDPRRPCSGVIDLFKDADVLSISYRYWVDMEFGPRGELIFVAEIFRCLPTGTQAASGSGSLRSAVHRQNISLTRRYNRPAARGIPSGFLLRCADVELHACPAHGERSLHDVVLLPGVDNERPTIFMQVRLDLVSAACYHLHLSIYERVTPEEEEVLEETSDMTETEWLDSDDDEVPFSLRTGRIKIASLRFPSDEDLSFSPYDW